MNIELLQEALQNNNNLSIMDTNIQKIKAEKNDILQKLGLKKNDLKSFNKKLKNYRYVDDIKDFTYGNSIRWINLKNIDNLRITNGCFLCDIKILDNGISLNLKTFNNKFITIYLHENLIFQKITDEENILLKAINFLEDK